MTVQETTECFSEKLKSLETEIKQLRKKHEIEFDITPSVYYDNHFCKTSFSLTPDSKIPQEIKDFYKSVFESCL